MGVLMAFHYTNFESGSLFSENPQRQPLYASIMLGEYHRFNTEEVDAHSLADASSYENEDVVLDEYEGEQVRSNSDADNNPPIINLSRNHSAISQESESKPNDMAE